MMEKIKKFAWTFTGVIVVFLFGLAFVPLIYDSVDFKDNRKKETQTPFYFTPVIPKSGEFIYIPVGVNKMLSSKKNGNSAIISTASFYYSLISTKEKTHTSLSYSNDYRIYNIVFQNKKSKDSHLLLYKKGLISHFFYPKEENLTVPFLLFSVIEKDTSLDGLFNKEDADTIYLSDVDGTHPQKILESVKLIDWSYEGEYLYLRVLEESSGDRLFDRHDTVRLYRVFLKDKKIQKLISDSTENKLQKLYR